MYRRTALVALILSAGWAASLRAQVIVTLTARDLDGNALVSEAIPPGSAVSVDILLAVGGDDVPLADVRLIQFDFSATSPELVLGQFTWRLEPGISDGSYLRFSELPRPSAVYFAQRRRDGFILDLDESPVRVASIVVTFNEAGALDALNVAGEDPGAGAMLSSGFFPRIDFSAGEGDFTGGRIEFVASGPPGDDGAGTPPDGDDPDEPEEGDDAGDGLDDLDLPTDDDVPADLFDPTSNDRDQPSPEDGDEGAGQTPAEGTDADDQIGREVGTDDDENRNLGPRVTGGFCGLAMLSTMIGLLCVVSLTRLIRLGRRRWLP